MKKYFGLLLCAGLYMPLAYLLLLSLSGRWAYPDLWPASLRGEAWRYLWHTDPATLHSLGLSIVLSLGVATVATSTGFWVGHAVAVHPRSERWLRAAYFPYAFSPVLYAFCLHYFFIRLGLSGSLSGVAISHFLIAFPFAVILFAPHWSREMLDMMRLARTLGADGRQMLGRVILPLSKNILLIGFFQTFLISWFDYGMAAVIGLGKVQTLTVKTYQFVGEANPYFAALAGVLLALPPVLLLQFNRRFLFRQT